MEAERVLEGLNEQQREAALCVRGPVCILAGAGTGKTTAITRRIAYQVASGAFRPQEILAVTFTDKAAGELRGRLAGLGVEGVVARTFHSAALAQLRGLSPEPPGEVLPSKALLLRQIGNRLPGAYRFRPAGDLATEIEWAKNRRLPPDRYAEVVESREPPIPADLMLRVYREYERRKAARGLVDFEDLLELAIRMFDTVPDACDRFRARYRAFTVDEFQDVNLLQRELLDRWLGDRDDLCVVGDDHQSIYSFTGASPAHLLGMPERFPRATVLRLEENYRSTPQVLALANRLSPRLGGVEKRLRATRPDGPEPVLRAFADPDAELAHLVAEIRRLAAAGVPHEELAVLYRVNSRSEDFEAPLREAGIPYQVRDGAFLERQAARRVLRQLPRSEERGVAGLVRDLVEAQGYVAPLPDGVGEQERVRQADLGRLLSLAVELDATHTVREYVEELERRFGRGGEAGRGVHLLTYHRAKGLEFEAVFLPRLEEGELPIRQAKSAEAVAEERRLLYVGITRAKRHLSVTWSRRPSRFLAELGVSAPPAARSERRERSPLDDSDPVLRSLRQWRRERSRADGVPAYVVFHDSTLVEIADRRPESLASLAAVPGVGPAKLERYGEEVLATLGETTAA